MRECIGCGYCCRKAPCGVISLAIEKAENSMLGEILFPKRWPDKGCPMLEWNGERWLCGFVVHAQDNEARDVLIKELAIGAGCTSGLNTYRLKRHVPTPKELENEAELLTRLNSEGRKNE